MGDDACGDLKVGLVLIPAMPTLGKPTSDDRTRGGARQIIWSRTDATGEEISGLAEGVQPPRGGLGIARSARATPSGGVTPRCSAPSSSPPMGPTKADDSDATRFHLGHDRRERSSSVINMRAIRSGIFKMYGSGSDRRRAISTFLAPAGQARWSSFSRPGSRPDHHRA